MLNEWFSLGRFFLVRRKRKEWTNEKKLSTLHQNSNRILIRLPVLGAKLMRRVNWFRIVILHIVRWLALVAHTSQEERIMGELIRTLNRIVYCYGCQFIKRCLYRRRKFIKEIRCSSCLLSPWPKCTAISFNFYFRIYYCDKNIGERKINATSNWCACARASECPAAVLPGDRVNSNENDHKSHTPEKRHVIYLETL